MKVHVCSEVPQEYQVLFVLEAILGIRIKQVFFFLIQVIAQTNSQTSMPLREDQRNPLRVQRHSDVCVPVCPSGSAPAQLLRRCRAAAKGEEVLGRPPAPVNTAHQSDVRQPVRDLALRHMRLLSRPSSLKRLLGLKQYNFDLTSPLEACYHKRRCTFPVAQ